MEDIDDVGLEAVSPGNSTASKAGSTAEVPNYWAVLLLLVRYYENLLTFMMILIP